MTERTYCVDEDLEKILDGIYENNTNFDKCYTLLNRGIIILSHENIKLNDDQLLWSFSSFLSRFIFKANQQDILGKYSSLVDNSYDFLSKNEFFEEFVEIEYSGVVPATESKLLILMDYLKEDDPFEGL